MIIRLILTFLFCFGAIETLRWLFFNRKDKEVKTRMKRWGPTLLLAILFTLILTK